MLKNKKLTLTNIVVLLSLVIFAYSSHSTAFSKDGLLHIYILDVGQGDAIFIETPDQNQILIDGGPSDYILGELSQVMPFFDRSIDMVVLTHPHSDHISGLNHVLERYDVSSIIQTKSENISAEFEVWQKKAQNEGADILEVKIGKSLSLGNNIFLDIIYPFESYDNKTVEPNDASIVTILRYGEFETILTGDIEARPEREILALGLDIDSDVIKIAHHGSKTSSEQKFLDLVSPKVALISVGARNRYGHPSEEVIERLENSSIPYYRTDVNGTIEVRSDGEHFSVHTEK